MSVAKSIASSIAKQLAQLVALADGGGGGSPSYLNFTVAADDETPSEGSTLTLTATDVGYPSGTYAANDSTPTELDPVTFTFTPATKTFQWDKGGSDIVGATSNPLVISNVNPTDDDGDYYVTVSDPVTGESTRFGPVTIAVGPPLILDTLSTSAAGAYSFRQLKATYTSSCIRVRESGGNTEADIGFADGVLDETALLAHCGANSGYIVTIYDQSGNSRDITQATTTKQPQIVASGTVVKIGSLPYTQFDHANDQYLARSGSVTVSGGAEKVVVAQPTNTSLTGNAVTTRHASPFCVSAFAATDDHFPGDGTTINNQWYESFCSTSRQLLLSSNTTAAPHIFRTRHTGTALVAAKDGSEGSGVGSTISNPDYIIMGCSKAAVTAASNQFWHGYVAEAIWFPSALSPADRAALQADQASYYGITV